MIVNSFLVVGYGSMGKRRTRLLRSINSKFLIAVVDSSEKRMSEATENGFCAFRSIEEAIKYQSFDAGLVCSAPLSHFELCKELLFADIAVFCELNLNSLGYEELQKISKEKAIPLFLSNTMLYRKETEYITNRRQSFAGGVGYIYHIGQYLPDWHPWEDYKDFFVGDVATSGIREILAIELAWLINAFGKVDSFTGNRTMLSQLKIPYADSLFTVLTHEGGTIGVLAVDVVSPKPVRSFELFGEGLHIFWEGSPDSLYYYDINSKEKKKIELYEDAQRYPGYSDNIVEDAYRDELSDFLSMCQNGTVPRYSISSNKAVLDIIEKIEGSFK